MYLIGLYIYYNVSGFHLEGLRGPSRMLGVCLSVQLLKTIRRKIGKPVEGGVGMAWW